MIGVCKEVVEGDLLHYLRLEIDIGVEVARFSIGGVELQC